MSTNSDTHSMGATLVAVGLSAVIAFPVLDGLRGIRIQYHSGGSLCVSGVSTTIGLGGVMSTTIPLVLDDYRDSFWLSAVGATVVCSVFRFFT